MATVIAIEDLRSVGICRTCGGIEEIPGPDGPPSYEQAQRGSCHPMSRPDWPGHDFNEHFHLCECCNQEVLSSGRRFDVWFCPECRSRAADFNDALRVWLIPIGRHSFMVRSYDPPGQLLAVSGEVMTSGSETEVSREIQRFTAGVTGMVASVNRLNEWSKRALLRNLDELGFEEGRSNP